MDAQVIAWDHPWYRKHGYQWEMLVKKLLLAGTTVLLMATSADAADWLYYPNARTYGCGASYAICQYRANLRRNGEYTYRRAHNGNSSPAYQRSL